MAQQSKKSLIDSVTNLLRRFKITDDQPDLSRWIGYKCDQIRADLIIKQYMLPPNQGGGVIDPTWLCAPFILNFHPTNYADNEAINDSLIIGKTTVPQLIDLRSNDGNLDLGIVRLVSMKNRTQYTYRRSYQWQYVPIDSPMSKFKYYDRVGQNLFINDDASQLMLTALLLHPEDGYLTNSDVVASGSLVNGTVYRVRNNQIIYANVVRPVNTTFTAGATTTYSGNGLVYLNSQIEAFEETDPYPASAEMIRQIEIEVLTKEFAIEKGQLTDVRNDSIDDTAKSPAV